MATVKTAISLPEALFNEADRLALELGVSRSRLIALALESFVRERQGGQLLKELNEAYGDGQTEELRQAQMARRPFRDAIAEEEW